MDMSSLSFDDTVKLVCHFHNTVNKNNRSDVNDLVKRGYNEDMIKALSKVAPSLEIKSCGLSIKGNVSAIKYEYFDYVMGLYEGYENGILPFNGSLADQPNQIINIFTIISILKNEHQQKLLDEQKKKDKLKSGRAR